MSNSQLKGHFVMLVESGSLTAHKTNDAEPGSSTTSQAEIRRGMSVQTQEGHTAGRVAAVVLDQDRQKVTHILLMQERKLLEYRLVPVELIEQVENEAIRLRTFQHVVDNLPPWHSS